MRRPRRGTARRAGAWPSFWWRPSSLRRQIQAARAQGDEEQPEHNADRQWPPATRQRQYQHHEPEPEEHHREGPDRELIALVRRGAPSLIHTPITPERRAGPSEISRAARR